MPKYSHRFTAALVLAMLLPMAAHALTNDEIRQQIAVLLAQLSAVQAQVAGLPDSAPVPEARTPTPSYYCPVFSRTLSRGMRGREVQSLQEFLIAERMLASDSGTGFFGLATEAALKEWQASKAIASSGDRASTGWGAVGPRTRTIMRAGCNESGNASSGLFGGRLTVSSSGLSVKVIVTVNTKGSCDAAVYGLDFGDGSALQNISVPANACAEKSATFLHTYGSAGSYTVTLRSGPLQVPIPITLKATTYASSTPPVVLSELPASSCPIYFKPTCTTDVLTWLGNDSNNCSLGYRCVPPACPLLAWSLPDSTSCVGTWQATKNVSGCQNGWKCVPPVISCPQYMLPLCPAGQHVGPGSINSNGCTVPGSCVPDASGTPSITLRTPSQGQAFTLGTSIPVSWSTSNVPSDAGMYIQLVERLDGDAVKSLRVTPESGSASINTGSFCNGNFSDAIDGDCFMFKGAIEKGKTSYFVRAVLFTPANACFGFCAPGSSQARILTTVESGTFTITGT